MSSDVGYPPFVVPGTIELEGRVLGGRYRIEKVIGEGGMGAVYAAVQEDLKRRVAVKVLLGEHSLDDVVRFRQEALAAAALGHPNIVQVTDFQAPPGEPPFLVMEALEGQSLKALMERHGILPLERTVFIAVQVLAALAVAHAAQIIHRDIKPGNIFLSRTPAANDFVKILDFGIAKRGGAAAGPQTADGLILGTPAYMAPEQALGMVVDHRTDLYAVGVCMYEMLSGRRPLLGATGGELLVAIARQKPPPLTSVAPDMDPNLGAIVDRMLAKDPAARPRSALEIMEALSPWAGSVVRRAKKRPGDISGELVNHDGAYELATVDGMSVTATGAPPTVVDPQRAQRPELGAPPATQRLPQPSPSQPRNLAQPPTPQQASQPPPLQSYPPPQGSYPPPQGSYPNGPSAPNAPASYPNAHASYPPAQPSYPPAGYASYPPPTPRPRTAQVSSAPRSRVAWFVVAALILAIVCAIGVAALFVMKRRAHREHVSEDRSAAQSFTRSS